MYRQLILQSPNPFLPGLPALPLFDNFDARNQPVDRLPGERPYPATRNQQPAERAPTGLQRPFAASDFPPPSPSRCSARCTRILLAAHMPPLSQPMLMRFARRSSRTPMVPITGSAAPPRFSLSAWAQWRSGDGVNALANDGELGGSQAGARARYRIVESAGAELALAARLSRPIERDQGAEAAIGVSVRPAKRLPIEFTLERRIALDNGGRNAWSVGVASGLYRQPLPLGLELDGYAQAGIVGSRSRDLYGDAAMVVSRPVPLTERSTLSLGGGVWTGVQPGVSRVDIGPEASVRLPAGDGGIRLSLSWRQRIAGSAAPGSGPALTLGADF